MQVDQVHERHNDMTKQTQSIKTNLELCVHGVGWYFTITCTLLINADTCILQFHEKSVLLHHNQFSLNEQQAPSQVCNKPGLI